YRSLLSRHEMQGRAATNGFEESEEHLKGWLYDRLGHHAEAIKCFSNLFEKVNGNPYKESLLKVLLANARLHAGDNYGATTVYLECLDAPCNHEILNNLGVAHFVSGHLSDSLSALENARAKVTNHPVINFNYALIALALSDRKVAEEQIRPLRKADAAL